MNDTTPEVDAEFGKRIAAVTPSERLRMMSGMFSTAKALACATLGVEGDDADSHRAAVFERMYITDFSAEEISAIAEHLRAVHAA